MALVMALTMAGGALADDGIMPLYEQHCIEGSRLVSNTVVDNWYYQYTGCTHGRDGYIHRRRHETLKTTVTCTKCDFVTSHTGTNLTAWECIHGWFGGGQKGFLPSSSAE